MCSSLNLHITDLFKILNYRLPRSRRRTRSLRWLRFRLKVRAALQIIPHRALIISPSRVSSALGLYLAMLLSLVTGAVQHPEKVTSTLKLLAIFPSSISGSPLSSSVPYPFRPFSTPLGNLEYSVSCIPKLHLFPKDLQFIL